MLVSFYFGSPSHKSFYFMQMAAHYYVLLQILCTEHILNSTTFHQFGMLNAFFIEVIHFQIYNPETGH